MSSGYDTSCITLSQEGKIYQIEYALKAVENGCTVTGIVVDDGVILAAEKIKSSRTIISNSNPMIFNITKTIGIAICGYIPDGRTIVSKAIKEAKSYRDFYGIEISGKILSDRIAMTIQTHTIHWYKRPFGAVVMIASYDKDGPHLYMIENNGVCLEYYSCSHGKGRQYVKNDVEKGDYSIRRKTVNEAKHDILKTLIKSYEGEKETEYDMSFITQNTKRHELVRKDELSTLIAKLKTEVEEERMMVVDN
jgi:20S proteasome subunit alpha 7